jgi:autotransporter-associated beta strand protein
MQAGAANVFSPNSNFIIPNHNVGGKLDLNSFDNTVGSLDSDEPDSQVLLGSATLTTGGTDADTTFIGVISGTGGLTKTGTGIFSLTGPNTYEGDTTVSAGTLAVDGDSIADTAKLVIADGAVVEVIETEGDVIEDVGSLFIGVVEAAAGTYGATGSGATNEDDTHFAGSGVIRVGAAGGYSDWADANGASGQTLDQDHDNDGVANGVEYFMGESDSTFTANPPVVVSGSDRTVTWPKDSAFSGSYVVETSPDLVNWTDVTGSVVDNGTSVFYTFPAPSGKLFVRLVVTPN